MKNKGNMKKLKYLIPIGAVLLASTQVIGAGVLKDIKVRQGDINITLNGEKIQLKDVNGKPVEPMIYEGSTYVPLRSIMELDKNTKINWNNDTTTVEIETKKHEKPTTDKPVQEKIDPVPNKEDPRDYNKRKEEIQAKAVKIEDIFTELVSTDKKELTTKYSNKEVLIQGKLTALDRTKGANIITLGNDENKVTIRCYTTEEEGIKDTNKLEVGKTYQLAGKLELVKDNVVLIDTILVK